MKKWKSEETRSCFFLSGFNEWVSVLRCSVLEVACQLLQREGYGEELTHSGDMRKKWKEGKGELAFASMLNLEHASRYQDDHQSSREDATEVSSEVAFRPFSFLSFYFAMARVWMSADRVRTLIVCDNLGDLTYHFFLLIKCEQEDFRCYVFSLKRCLRWKWW